MAKVFPAEFYVECSDGLLARQLDGPDGPVEMWLVARAEREPGEVPNMIVSKVYQFKSEAIGERAGRLFLETLEQIEAMQAEEPDDPATCEHDSSGVRFEMEGPIYLRCHKCMSLLGEYTKEEWVAKHERQKVA